MAGQYSYTQCENILTLKETQLSVNMVENILTSPKLTAEERQTRYVRLRKAGSGHRGLGILCQLLTDREKQIWERLEVAQTNGKYQPRLSCPVQKLDDTKIQFMEIRYELALRQKIIPTGFGSSFFTITSGTEFEGTDPPSASWENG